jgi:Fe2+ transport system protein FeoA
MSLPSQSLGSASDPSDSASLPRPLTELRSRAGRVVAVEAEAGDAARLKAMGICVGRRLVVIQAGDPLIVKVVGSRVGISARLAAGVLVVEVEPSADPTSVA